MARSCNGTSDLLAIDAARIVAKSTAFAISLAINGPSVSTKDEYIYSESRSTTNVPLFGIHQPTSNPGHIEIFIRADDNTVVLQFLIGTHAVLDNTWHHITYTQDASNNAQVYADSERFTVTYGWGTHTFTSDRATAMGLRRTTTSNWTQGNIAQLALFNRNLGASEGQALAAGLPASFLGPLHYWPLGGVDAAEPDLGSGAKVTPTLTGTALVVPDAPFAPSMLSLAA